MNATLLASATGAIPETELLVNMVRLRVRQLAQGARPLIVAPPGMGLADIALSEIAAGKLISEAKPSPATAAALPPIVAFPAGAKVKRAA